MDIEEMREKALLPVRHPDIDIFICDFANAALKNDIASMEHPIFTLSKKPDFNQTIYEHNGNKLIVSPSSYGKANIWDKDILIYAISQIMEAKKKGLPYSQELSFVAHDFLIFSNRQTNGNGYTSLRDGLRRLQGTMLETNIKTGGEEQVKMFGLVDYTQIRRKLRDGTVSEWGIKLSDWLFNAIHHNEVLTMHPDYFRLRKPIERRVYEIARKHCGVKREWRISLDILQKKCGSKMPPRNFRKTITDFSKLDHLPDYKVSIENDVVIFGNTGNVEEKSIKRQIHTASYNSVPPLRAKTYDKFRALYPDYDPHYVEEEWREWIGDKPAPDNADAAFMAFAKTHVSSQQRQSSFSF